MKFKSPVVADMVRANKLVKKLKLEDVAVFYPHLEGDLRMVSFSDAAHANLSDRVSSGGGHVVLLVDDRGEQGHVLALRANKIKRVVRSTLAAEALALQEALEHVPYLKNLLHFITN